MRLERLELQNFRSFESLDLDLSSVSCAALIGRNGAGKSTVAIAINFALFGGGADDLLRWGTDRGGVSLTFSLSGETWKVNRGRERAKRSWLVIEHNGQAMDTHTINQAQEFLDKLLGFDEDAFCATSYAPQGRAGELAAMSPGERKALLAGLVGLDEYEGWRVDAATKSRELRARIGTVQTIVERSAERVARLEAATSAAAEIEQQIKVTGERLTALEGYLEQAHVRDRQAEQVRLRERLVVQMGEIKELAAMAKILADRRAEVEAHIAGAAGARERLSDQEAAYERYRASVAEAEAKAREAASESRRCAQEAESLMSALHRVSDGETEQQKAITSGKRQLEQLDAEDARCQTCGQPVEAEAKAKARARAQEQMDAARTLLNELTAERLRIEARRPEARAEAEAWAEKAKERAPGEYPDQQELEACRRDVEALARAEATLAAIQEPADVEALRAKWAKLRDEAAELPKVVEGGASVAEVKASIERVTGEHREAEQHLQSVERNAVEVKRIREEIAEHERDLDVDEAQAQALEACARAFSRDGIPAMVLDNLVGGIEAATNDTLERLDSPLRMRLITQKAKKSGKGTTETLELLVDDGAHERPLSTFSGGEGYRVHIALRLGLAAVLSAGSGVECDFMLIDEPTDLDGEGIATLAELLPRIGKQVLLITHEEELVDKMPQRLSVQRDLGAGAASAVTLD